MLSSSSSSSFASLASSTLVVCEAKATAAMTTARLCAAHFSAAAAAAAMLSPCAAEVLLSLTWKAPQPPSIGGLPLTDGDDGGDASTPPPALLLLQLLLLPPPPPPFAISVASCLLESRAGERQSGREEEDEEVEGRCRCSAVARMPVTSRMRGTRCFKRRWSSNALSAHDNPSCCCRCRSSSGSFSSSEVSRGGAVETTSSSRRNPLVTAQVTSISVAGEVALASLTPSDRI
mmetsp:Transcript_7474/g.14065  ORF Transcript_7474/g.14065 Transcript_7474/m.14065 type:complete len:233 (-) Transcript_7474:55-753(-)